MNAPGQLEHLVEEYSQLTQAQNQRPLNSAESRRLDTLREVILGASSLVESDEHHHEPRQPRAPVALDVRFLSREDAGRAQTLNVSSGGMAIETARPLPRGTKLHLSVQVPGWKAPLVVDGDVVWSNERAMGILFHDLQQEDARRLKDLVVENGSLVTRLRSVFTTQQKPVPASVAGGASALLCVSDEFLADVTAELLGVHGFAVFEGGERKYDVVIADPGSLARAMAVGWGRPLIMVNASGPDALVGRFSSLRPVAWISRPASAARIVEAARRIASATLRATGST